MDSIRYHLLENPFYVLALLAMAELVIAGVWYSRRTRRLAVALLAPVTLAGLAVLLAAVVKTDREQIRDLSGQIAADIRAGRLDAAARVLDDAYEGWGGDKAQTVAMGRGLLAGFHVTDMRIIWTTLEVESGRAQMQAQTIVSYNLPAMGEGRNALQWRLYWIKRPGGWRILQVDEPVQALELNPPR